MMQETSQVADAFETLCGRFKDAVAPFVAPGQPYALMDFPNHSNVGDSAIWIGELAFFDAHVGRPASFVNTCYDDPGAVAAHLPEGPIFIHGGGNFGDIWPQHQKFRLRALEALRGRPLVQLPQSIYFNDTAARDETARAIAAHGAFTLMVRDQPSFELAKAHFDCEVRLAPDAAVNIRHLSSPPPRAEVISFLRGDRESAWAEAADFLKTKGDVTDWPAPDVWTLPDRIGQKLFKVWPGAAMRHREAMSRRQAQARLMAGTSHLSQGRIIVSDRLHVHLIAALMRRDHIVLDNVYGKIGRHIDAWGDFGLATRVTDLAGLKAALEAG